MLSIQSVKEIQQDLAEKLVKLRKHHRHSRAVASARSGVPAATIRRFEDSGEISLRQFLMLCEAYRELHKLSPLFDAPPARTMDELMAIREREARWVRKA